MDFIEIINELQKYTIGAINISSDMISMANKESEMPKEVAYKLLIEFLPKGKRYLQYIKGAEGKYSDELISIVALHFEESKEHAIEYIGMLHQLGKITELSELLSKYGYDEAQIKKLM